MRNSNESEFDDREFSPTTAEDTSRAIARRYYSKIYFSTLRKGDYNIKAEKVIGLLNKNLK